MIKVLEPTVWRGMMMRRILFATLLIGVTMALQSGAVAFNKNETRKEQIRLALRDYLDAYVKKDSSALERLLAHDYLAMNGKGKLGDKGSELAEMKDDRTVYESFTIEELHLGFFGNTAIATGILSVKGKPEDGARFAIQVRFLNCLVKRGRRWQIIATQSAPFHR